MKIIAGILFTIMVFMSPSTTITDEVATPDIISEQLTSEEILIANGFDTATIDSLSEYTKTELAKQLQDSPTLEFEVVTASFESEDNQMVARGQIPDDDLLIIITTEITKVEYGTIKEITVKVYYEWLNLPFWRIQDPIIISWDSDKFTYKPGSFYSEDRYSTNELGDVLHTSRTNYYDKNNNTLCWYSDLKDSYLVNGLDAVNGLYGFGEIVLEPNEGYQYYGQSSVGATYVHSKLLITATVSLGFTVGFEIPGTGNDQVATSVRVNWNQPIYLTPADYGYEQQYFYYEKTLPITIAGTTFNTVRLRTGYIEEEYIVLSPRRSDAGEAYLVYSFDTDVIQMNVDLTFWSANEYLSSNDAIAVVQYKDSTGNWVTILDLMNDIELPTDRTAPLNTTILFPDEVREVRFYVSCSPVGDRNKGRICIGDMELYLER